MIRTLLYLFILFLRILVPVVQGFMVTPSVADSFCPPGSTKVVNYIQRYRQKPYQPEIYTIDCLPASEPLQSDTPLPFSQNIVPSRLVRRQSTTCASPMCYGGGGAPSLSDCSDLVTYLTNRASTQTTIPQRATTAVSGTCQFAFTSQISMQLSDTAWAALSADLIQKCIPGQPWAMCNGSGYFAQVTTVNQLSQSASTTANAATTSIATSSNGGTSTSQNTVDTTSSPATTASSTNPTTSLPSGMTTSSNIVPIFSVGTTQSSNNSQDSSPNVGQISTNNGRPPSGGNRALNIPAIIGGILGGLAFILLIATGIWIRRRNKQRLEKDQAPEGEKLDEIQQVPQPLFVLEVSSPTLQSTPVRRKHPIPQLSFNPDKRASGSFVSPFLPTATPVTSSNPPSVESTSSTGEHEPDPTEDGHQRQEIPPLTVPANILNQEVHLFSPPVLVPPPPDQLPGVQLSEDMINHMADTIIAQMPLTPMNDAIHANTRRLSQLEVVSPGQQEEAPPPWSES